MLYRVPHEFLPNLCLPGIRRSKKGGDPLRGTQPTVRLSYNSYMGGVDVADQRCGTYLVNHKPKGFLWRRVFDQSLFTALTNAELLYQWWVEDSLVKVGEALASIGLDGADDDAVLEGPAEGLSRLQLTRIQDRLTALLCQLERKPVWKKELGKYLMVEFRQIRGSEDGDDVCEKLKSAPSHRRWYRVLEHGRACNGPDCPSMTKGCCRCQECRRYDEGGVVICQSCFRDPKQHREAADVRQNIGYKGRLRKRIPWERLVEMGCEKGSS